MKRSSTTGPRRLRWPLALALLAFLAAPACAEMGAGSDEAAMDGSTDRTGVPPQGNTGVGQSGAQDFGRFRSIIEAGELPAPNTLDAVGFFNEHKFELPPPDCGESVCLHGLFGVQGNMINGSNCTVIAIGFNTSLKPEDFQRPPLNLAIAVDTSASMSGPSLQAAKVGLEMLADTLEVKDIVKLVAFNDEATLTYTSTPEDDPERQGLRSAIAELDAAGEANIYDGLRLALESVEADHDPSWQNRIILVSDGVATAGITDRERIINLGATYASQGYGLTTIGLGQTFDVELMRRLSETGAGNFYFLEDFNAVDEVFAEEVQTFMIPLAEDVRIEAQLDEAYTFRAAYGTRLWEGDRQSMRIAIPGLFMAGRQTVDDVTPGGGRRGGGGIILAELVPSLDEALLASRSPESEVGTITMRYTPPGASDPVEQTTTVLNPLQAGETPDEGRFDNFTVEKAFVALNIFAGFHMASERASSGSPSAALSVLVPLAENVEAWLEEHDDYDIEADLELMQKFIALLQQEGEREEISQPPNPWPQD